MPAPHQLSALQLDVMRALWSRGEARVAEVHADLSAGRGLAPTTVATLLTRLQRQGLVEVRREGRQLVYHACVEEAEARAGMVEELTERLFQGDASQLLCHLVEAGRVTDEDLTRIRALLAKGQQASEAQPRSDKPSKRRKSR